MAISNIFNNYIYSIANKTKLNISFSHKYFAEFAQIENVIYSLDFNQLDLTVLKVLKNDISSQLSEIFNISFFSGVFPSILKTPQIIHVDKEESKLDFSNYSPTTFLSNFEKYYKG